MHRRRLPLLICAVSALFITSTLPANSATIAGTKCTKINSTKTISNIKYTCVKSGKVLIWNKGVTIKAQVSPTPIPTKSSAVENSQTILPSKPVSSSPTPSPAAIDVRVNAQKYELSPETEFQNLQNCKISSPLQNAMNNGFPRSSNLVPSKGLVKGIAIFTEYSDLPATGDEIRVWKTQQIPTAQKYFKTMSYGKLDFQVDINEKVYRINKSVLNYNLDTAHGAPTKPNADTQGLVKDAVNAADIDIDFSKYDFVSVITPSTSLIGFEGVIGFDYSADGKQFHYATFGPIREYKDDPAKYPWLVHEAGHMMGLIHPYNTSGNFYKNFAIIAWDLMGNAITFAPEFLAWHKFMLGWFEPNQVQCLNSNVKSVTTSLITPISEDKSGIKAELIRISETEVIIVENRRTSSLNNISREEEGIFVYHVDAKIGPDMGAVTVLFNRQIVRNGHLIGTLLPGEVVKHNNVTIEVLSSAVDGDYVTIKIS